MKSFGEEEIHIGNLRAGKVRVSQISALDALHPRIGVLVGVSLHRIQDPLYSGQAASGEFRLTDLGGDLRLSEKGPSIGLLHWIGPHNEVRAQPHPSETQIQLACDVDLWTLERVEKQRLAVTLKAEGRALEDRQNRGRREPPRDDVATLVRQRRHQRKRGCLRVRPSASAGMTSGFEAIDSLLGDGGRP